MKELIVFSIYFSGYIVCYFVFKAFYKSVPPKIEWCLADRLIALSVAILSWPGVVFCAIGYVIEKIDADFNKPVKW